MRQIAWNTVLFTVIVLSSLALPACGNAAGPWKAQVVDAETGEPLEGVVVLVVWLKYSSTLAGWAGGEYYASEEVVTGPDGRFRIPARSLWVAFDRSIHGPDFKIFKPGYGRWGFQGEDKWLQLEPWERDKRIKEAWAQFTGAGVVLELPPLKTRAERLSFLRSVTWSGLVPSERTEKLRKAKDAEREYLGLRG